MAHLLIIGSPSLDTVHIDGETYETIGGGGMYVAMAARRRGARVSMFGPRPDPVPEVLTEFADRLEQWLGPVVPLERVPRFEIEHQGETAVYLDVDVQAQTEIDPHTLPTDLFLYDAVHVTAMGDADVQNAFLELCRERGARLVSVGTWLGNIQRKTEMSKKLIADADLFFMNEREVSYLYGSAGGATVAPGQVLYATRAEKGAMVAQGEYQTFISAASVTVKDPTGAGESFCGTALAGVLLGDHPVIAGKKAILMAGEEIGQVGPAALMRNDPPPEEPLDRRVRIDENRVEEIAAIVRNLREADPFTFTGDYLPPAGHPAALDYFFAVTLQQFGFWEADSRHYLRPMIAIIDGQELKGSTYMYGAFRRKLDTDPGFFTPERQATLTMEELSGALQDDNGVNPLPAAELHLEMARRYGSDMLALGLTPSRVLEMARDSSSPLSAFVHTLDRIGGYKEDPIRKKTGLLAVTLNQRPEAFLTFGPEETIAPVVDYHCLRGVLRLGLVDVLDDDLRAKLAGRHLLAPDEEWAVRHAAYRIQAMVEKRSGRPIGAVDWFFFNYIRTHCPEMTDPVCSKCVADPVCAKRKELFQPVIRTSFY
jgi:sugar/nucleoside kinase (ribokinase family)